MKTSKRITIAPGLLLGLGYLLLSSQAEAGKLVTEPRLMSALERKLDGLDSRYKLATDRGEILEKRIEKYISDRMDLERAEVMYREDRDRITYLEGDVQAVSYYRRSPQDFSYRKMEENPSERLMDSDELIAAGRVFLEEHGLLHEDAKDRVCVVRERTLNADLDNADGSQKDVVLLQGLKYRRAFAGLQVVNSLIGVDFQPETSRVLGLKHRHWTPVAQDGVVEIRSSEVKSADEIMADLEELAAPYVADRSARITDLELFWYQTDKELVPAIGFQIEATEAGPGTFILVNPLGDNKIFGNK